jgi:hypothetical protein
MLTNVDKKNKKVLRLVIALLGRNESINRLLILCPNLSFLRRQESRMFDFTMLAGFPFSRE